MKRAFVVLLLLAACGREGKLGTSQPASKSTPKKVAASTETTAAAMENPSSAEVGDTMPAYSTKFLDGKTFDVAAEKGSVVFLNVWATWCGPCRFEIPELQKLHEKYVSKGLKVIGVSVDDIGLDAVKQFVRENKMTYPIALDADGRVANVLRTTNLPTSVIIGRNGKILWRKIGPVMPNEVESVDSVLQKALSKS